MSKILMAICVALPLAAVASAQTASELADRYPHHEVYEVQPGVQMKAKFASNGLVCEMQIEQTHFVKDGVDLRLGIEKELISSLIDELVPSSERGEKDPAGNMIQGWGAGITEIDTYSNVTVDISSSHGTAIVSVKWRHRTCDGQEVGTASVSPQNISSWACARADAPWLVLLQRPSVRPPGLNISSDCLPARHTEFLKFDLRSIEQAPLRSGTPMICGIAHYREAQTYFCTRG